MEGVFNISTGYAALTFTATNENDDINVAIVNDFMKYFKLHSFALKKADFILSDV